MFELKAKLRESSEQRKEQKDDGVGEQERAPQKLEKGEIRGRAERRASDCEKMCNVSRRHNRKVTQRRTGRGYYRKTQT